VRCERGSVSVQGLIILVNTPLMPLHRISRTVLACAMRYHSSANRSEFDRQLSREVTTTVLQRIVARGRWHEAISHRNVHSTPRLYNLISNYFLLVPLPRRELQPERSTSRTVNSGECPDSVSCHVNPDIGMISDHDIPQDLCLLMPGLSSFDLDRPRTPTHYFLHPLQVFTVLRPLATTFESSFPSVCHTDVHNNSIAYPRNVTPAPQPSTNTFISLHLLSPYLSSEVPGLA